MIRYASEVSIEKLHALAKFGEQFVMPIAVTAVTVFAVIGVLYLLIKDKELERIKELEAENADVKRERDFYWCKWCDSAEESSKLEQERNDQAKRTIQANKRAEDNAEIAEMFRRQAEAA